MENTSGHGPMAVVPPELDNWNWGAFLLNWIWGAGNGTWIAFFVFLPVVGWVMPFVLGAKGSAWAWRNRHWESLDHFKRVQRKWAIWGVALLLTTIAAMIAFVVAGIMSVVLIITKDSTPYKLGVARLESDHQVMRILGSPISTGFPSGGFNVSGSSGKAHFTFPVSGPLAKGEASVRATRTLGVWRINSMVITIQGHGTIIIVGTSLPPALGRQI